MSIEPPALEEAGESGEVPLAAMVEPYRGRPQLKGMRVRAKPVGAGSGKNGNKMLQFWYRGKFERHRVHSSPDGSG